MAEVVDVPLCVDTANHQVLAALAVGSGKLLVKSVTGEEASLEALLLSEKKHGCLGVGTYVDEQDEVVCV